MSKQFFNVSKTYDVVTPESASRGDTAENDFVYESRPMTLKQVLEEVQSLGYCENFQPGSGSQSLYGVDPSDVDYSTGAETREALHIDGSDRAMARLNALLEKHKLVS